VLFRKLANHLWQWWYLSVHSESLQAFCQLKGSTMRDRRLDTREK